METKDILNNLNISRARLSQLRDKYLLSGVDFTCLTKETRGRIFKRYKYKHSALNKLRTVKKHYNKNILKLST